MRTASLAVKRNTSFVFNSNELWVLMRKSVPKDYEIHRIGLQKIAGCLCWLAGTALP